jgi:hypothetical protein
MLLCYAVPNTTDEGGCVTDVSEFEWEEFDRRSAPKVSTPIITLQKRGNFGINRAAFEAMGRPEAVKLLYDRKQQVIGIRPADDPEARNAYQVRKQPNSDSFLFSGIAFAHRYGIPLGETRRFRSQMRGDVMIVDLKQEPLASWNPDKSRHRDELGQYVPTEAD